MYIKRFPRPPYETCLVYQQYIERELDVFVLCKNHLPLIRQSIEKKPAKFGKIISNTFFN